MIEFCIIHFDMHVTVLIFSINSYNYVDLAEEVLCQKSMNKHILEIKALIVLTDR